MRLGQLSSVVDADPDEADHSFNYSQWPTQATKSNARVSAKSTTHDYKQAASGGRLKDIKVGGRYRLHCRLWLRPYHRVAQSHKRSRSVQRVRHNLRCVLRLRPEPHLGLLSGQRWT
jgi:hypothetical protein